MGYRDLEVSQKPLDQVIIFPRSASSHVAGVTRGRSITQAAGCDHIIVLDRDSIVEEGSYEGLLALGGWYAGLWRIWLANR